MWFLIWCRRKMKIILAGIVLLAAAADADVCVSPRLFAAGDLRVYAYNIDLDEITSETVFQRYYYDENNKQLRFDGIHNGSRYTIYQKYNEKKQYLVANGHCIAIKLNGEFHSFSPPEYAEDFVRGKIGTKGESVDIVRYFTGGKGVKSVATYTAKDCLLTNAFKYERSDHGRFIYYMSMTDVVLHVDESAFKLPSSCHDGLSRLRRRTLDGILDNLVHLKHKLNH